MDLISMLLGIIIGQACGILIATISLEKAENEVNEKYRIYLEREKDCGVKRI